ncbi:MAG: Hint domain-containing protein [Rhodospirillales bacterium]|nr:Hint domain-containing protein [Rhodospirillales bacterium]
MRRRRQAAGRGANGNDAESDSKTLTNSILYGKGIDALAGGLAVANAYYEYAVSPDGATYSLSASATGKAPPAAYGITDSSGNVNVLGDVNPDSFVFNNKAGHTFTYEGVANFPISGTQTLTGFIALDTSLNTYHFFSTSSVLVSTAVVASSFTSDAPSTTSTWWNIDAAAPGCFVAGTLIATPGGAVPVETLAAGDLVLTADGRALPVRWLGRSTINLFRAADRASLLPIRIRAGALDENMPARDLLVSPGHAIRVGDVLAHAGALVNGTSIVQERDMPMVFPYYHVELDSHAVLRAEGAPAESFLDGVEDLAFDNAGERPAGGTMQEMDCPRIRSARQLPRAVKEHLAARAATLSGTVAAAA